MNESVESLVAYCRENDRVCPLPPSGPATSSQSRLQSGPFNVFRQAAHLEHRRGVIPGGEDYGTTHLDGTVAGVGEVVCALGGTEEIEELSDLSPSGLDVTRLSVSDEMLELGEDLLDRVEIGAVGRQKDEVRAFGSNDGAGGFALVAAEVVQDDDIARQEGWGEDLLDVEEEDFASWDCQILCAGPV